MKPPPSTSGMPPVPDPKSRATTLSATISRRQLLRRAGLTLATVAATGAPGLAGGASAQGAETKGRGSPALEPLNRLPQMMQLYWMGILREIEERGKARFAGLRTAPQARAHASEIAAAIRKCFGELPAKTPLKPRTVAVHARAGYRIENVFFESRPNFIVSANLYLPESGGKRVPGVVGCCGHMALGKAAEPYQSFAQGLVRKGFAVLVFDPIGLGERLDYLEPDGKSLRGVGVGEHLFAGNQQFLVGENAAAWNVWDAMRAVDYLLARPEVDPAHLGITGNSGGGMLTTWMCALEPRLTMAAPSCFVTTLRHILANELPSDTEQCPPGILGAGLDHADFFVPFAPRRLMLLGQEKDFFDIRGFHEARERVEAFYRLLGAEGSVGSFVGSERHGFFQANREAMYGAFLRAAGLGREAAEPEIRLEDPATLRCSPTGQVASLGSKPVAAFTRERSIELARLRPALAGVDLQRRVRTLLRLDGLPTDPPEYRMINRPLWARSHPRRAATVYALATDPGIEAIVYRLDEESLYSRPPRGAGEALLYVSHLSADTELREDPHVRTLVGEDVRRGVFACDVRGIGESRPNTCRKDFFDAYGPDYFYAIYGVMLGRCYAAQRTWDVLRVARWVKSLGYDGVHLVAKGWGAIPATFAAVLSSDIQRVTLINPLRSYASVAETMDYAWFFSAFVPDVLRHFDLPDCYRELAAKGLVMIDPREGGEPVGTERLALKL